MGHSLNVVFVIAFLFFSIGVAKADESKICEALLRFESEFNKEAPKKSDSMTEVIHIKVNCDNEIVVYTMRILAEEKQLAKGWRERKQRQHNQLHCNNNGLSSKLGWTAMTVLFDVNYNILFEMKTSKNDC